jgi:uncharacterized protein
VSGAAVDQAAVSALSLAAVKGTRLQTVGEIELGPNGARGDRVFYVIDARARMRNAKQIGELQAVSADYDPALQTLSLSFPGGDRVQGQIGYGELVETRFFSERMPARPLEGPWSEALSQFLEQPVQIVAPEGPAMDRGWEGAASIISSASLRRLASVADRDSVDPRRFRMLIEVDGIDAHGEDAWMGRRLRIGAALVEVLGNVGRCLVTSRDPDSGEIDLPTLDLLRSYRRETESTEPLPFGVHAAVVQPGRVRLGDPVVLEGDPVVLEA